MSSRLDLARTLGYVAAILERDGFPYCGPIREAARTLLEGAEAEDGGRRCRGCGAELPPPGPQGGRPRDWCPASACQRARKTGAKP